VVVKKNNIFTQIHINMLKNFIAILSLFIGFICYPQLIELKLNLHESHIVLSGNSTFGNWKSKAKSFKGNFSFIDDKNSSNPKKGFASIKINSDSIISRSKLRDGSTHKALKYKEFPFIKFTSDTGKLYKKITDKKIQLIVTGVLNIAGKSKTVSMLTNLTELSKNSLEFEGQYKLKMTDYNIKPPSVLFGLIKVEDEININYRLVFTN